MQITLPDIPDTVPVEAFGAGWSRCIQELEDERLDALYCAINSILPLYACARDLVNEKCAGLESVLKQIEKQRSVRLRHIITSCRK